MDVGLRIQMRMDGPDDLFRSYHIRDISLGGVFVRSRANRPVDTDVVLRIEFADGSRFEAQGRVARVVHAADDMPPSQVPGMGVEFEVISADSWVLLANALRMRAEAERAGPPDTRRG